VPLSATEQVDLFCHRKPTVLNNSNRRTFRPTRREREKGGGEWMPCASTRAVEVRSIIAVHDHRRYESLCMCHCGRRWKLSPCLYHCDHRRYESLCWYHYVCDLSDITVITVRDHMRYESQCLCHCSHRRTWSPCLYHCDHRRYELLCWYHCVCDLSDISVTTINDHSKYHEIP